MEPFPAVFYTIGRENLSQLHQLLDTVELVCSAFLSPILQHDKPAGAKTREMMRAKTFPALSLIFFMFTLRSVLLVTWSLCSSQHVETFHWFW